MMKPSLKVAAPEGRSMLTWKGKRVLRLIRVPPARVVETFALPGQRSAAASVESLLSNQPSPNSLNSLIFQGDNKDVLACLLGNGLRGKVKLIYIDPPFDTGGDFTRKVTLRGQNGKLAIQGDIHPLGEQVQYTDSWANDSYLQFMYERMLLLRELLAEDGSIWLHCDHRRVHYLRLLMEEVFGAGNYLNTISWRSQTARGAKVNAFFFPYSTQYIEVFARNRAAPTTWNVVRKQIIMSEAEASAEFMHDAQGFFRTSDPGTYRFESLATLHAQGRLYAPYGGQVLVDETTRRVYASNGGNIGVKYYLKKLGAEKYLAERAVDNMWSDIPGLGTTPGEDLGYPTQKTEALLRRIILVSTNPDDLVLDCFAGSGTTVAVAQKLGRRWIACDANKGAIQTMTKRLQWVMLRQVEEADGRHHTAAGKRRVIADEGSEPDKPYASTPELQFVICSVGAAELTVQRHDPVKAGVTFKRDQWGASPVVVVAITEFVSPAINDRLQQGKRRSMAAQQTVTDWRMMVDSVMIDTAYDGEVFNVTLSDAPQKKHALVKGEYVLPAPPDKTRVAVRITDVLGAEVMVTQCV